MMLYDYQYDLAAIVFTIILIGLYARRRNYATRASHIFVAMMVCDLFAAFFDLVSCFTISYPHSVPKGLNEFICLGYLFFFNMVSLIYFLYIDEQTGIGRLKKINRAFFAILSGVYAFVIFSSPWTHFVAYFDNYEYKHGPFMAWLYVISFATFIYEIYMLLKANNELSRRQYVASVAFVVTMLLSVFIQMIWSRLMISQLGCVMVLFFVYMDYENPAFYSFRDTSCLNRRAFTEKLSALIPKLNKEKYGVLVFFVDDYQYLIRSYGLAETDKLVGLVASRLYKQFGNEVFCLADDKYTIIVPPKKGFPEYTKGIAAVFEEPFRFEGVDIKLNVTVCTVPYLDAAFSTDEVEELVEYRITNPDESLDSVYTLKNIIDKKHYREQIVRAIERAIQKNSFKVFYQPIFNTVEKNFDSAEALIRLTDEEIGFIDPETLIRVAEESGYIQEVGEVVFRNVCAFVRDSKPENAGIKYVEVNLSPLQMDDNAVGLFKGILDEYGVAPDKINFEITETAHLANERRVLMNIRMLSERGLGFSIDDYGSGFASADYLVKLPVSIVKIDKSILWQAVSDTSAMKVLSHTIRMLKDLGKNIVVEGVETQEMEQLLLDMGCDHLQGYYYSKAIPESEFVEFIKVKNDGFCN